MESETSLGNSKSTKYWEWQPSKCGRKAIHDKILIDFRVDKVSKHHVCSQVIKIIEKRKKNVYSAFFL